MDPGSTTLTEAVRAVHYLKIEGYSAARAVTIPNPIRSTWNVGGYDWEVLFHHACINGEYWVVLNIVFRGERSESPVRASLGCRLVDPGRNPEPSGMKNVSNDWASFSYRFVDPRKNPEPSGMNNVSGSFRSPRECSPDLLLMKSELVAASRYLNNDSLTVECTITVLKELPKVVIPSQKDAPLPLTVPPSDLHEHLRALLQSQTGGDVTFVLGSGERFLAHKNILAARSPVFMAEFFGNMEERSSRCVQIQDMEAAVFSAMLHFIYTDTVPELDDEEQAGMAVTMAQHLLAAADRYGLDRLKLICEAKLSCGIDVDTAATTLALAEQHNCSLLKARCVDFITASPEKLDAVLATEGYRHLVTSCPLVLTELLKAAHGRKN